MKMEVGTTDSVTIYTCARGNEVGIGVSMRFGTCFLLYFPLLPKLRLMKYKVSFESKEVAK